MATQQALSAQGNLRRSALLEKLHIPARPSQATWRWAAWGLLIACWLLATGEPLAAQPVGSSPHPEPSPRFASPATANYPDATTIYAADFEPGDQHGLAAWPADWQRLHGPGYPAYVRGVMRPVREQAGAADGRAALVFQLDGGGAAAQSRSLGISPRSSYVLEASIQRIHLAHDDVYLLLEFRDIQGRVVQSLRSESAPAAHWHRVRIGPVTPPSDEVTHATIGLRVEPGERADLHGMAMFDAVWLGSLPRLTLESSATHGLARAGEPITFVASLTGLPVESEAQLELTLFDAWQVRDVALAERVQVLDTIRATDVSPTGAPAVALTRSWLLTAAEPGYYHVQAKYRGPSGHWHHRELAVAVVNERGFSATSNSASSAIPHDFAWSLTGRSTALPTEPLALLSREAAVGTLKFPAWSLADDEPRLTALAQTIAEFRRQQIHSVAIFDHPPESVLRSLGITPSEATSVAETLVRDPQIWGPSLEQPLLRLGLLADAWQLGTDDDYLLTTARDPALYLATMRKWLDRTLPEAEVALPWLANVPLPERSANSLPTASLPTPRQESKPPPADQAARLWQAVSLPLVDLGLEAQTEAARQVQADEATLEAAEALAIEMQLAEMSLGHDSITAALIDFAQVDLVRLWCTLPAVATDTSLEQRAASLAARMVRAKMQRATLVTIADPVAAGLLHADGTPGQLYLPWRTMARSLSGCRYLGSLMLPGGSENHLFLRGDEVVMVVRRATAGEEQLYLGNEVRQTDLWGRSHTVPRDGSIHRLRVGPLPVIVEGLSEPLTRFRLSAILARSQMPSILGTRQENAIELQNPFSVPIAGEAYVVMPDTWHTRPAKFAFQLAPGERHLVGIESFVPRNATTGPQQMRIDFVLQTPEPQSLSVYHPITLGDPTLRLEATARLDSSGELIVTTRATNLGNEERPLRLSLFAPTRRRERFELLATASGESVHQLRLPLGEQLVGQTLWLRAEQTDTRQVFNLRFVAGSSGESASAPPNSTPPNGASHVWSDIGRSETRAGGSPPSAASPQPF